MRGAKSKLAIALACFEIILFFILVPFPVAGSRQDNVAPTSRPQVFPLLLEFNHLQNYNMPSPLDRDFLWLKNLLLTKILLRKPLETSGKD
jgi:hypothetical protein